MKYFYTGSTFRFIHWYIILRPFRHEQKTSQETLIVGRRCILGKFFVVPTFVTKCLHVGKDVRDPGGKRWNYLSRKPSSMFAEITASIPFRDRFLATNQRQGGDGNI
jgi:hypothetical protein